MKYSRFIVPLLLSLALLGCGTKSPIGDKSRPLLQPANGLALASFGYVQTDDSVVRTLLSTVRITIKMRRTDIGDKSDARVLRFDHGGTGAWVASETVLVSQGRVRAVSSMELEPGRYEVFAYELYGKYGGLEYTLKRNYTNPIPFLLHAAEVMYIGSHELEVEVGKNLLGMSAPGRTSLAVLDRFQQDLDLLHSVRPETGPLPAASALH